MNSRPLIIFTHHYPFGDLELFLETEILYLSEVFSRIIIIPNRTLGLQRNVPNGVVVETAFAETYQGKEMLGLLKKTWRALFYRPLYRELASVRKELSYLKKLFGFSSEVSRCANWLNSYLRKHPDLQSALFYTYWFYDHTTGIARLTEKYPAIRLISRAHGFDLYEEDYPPAYIPFRQFCLQTIDKLVLISKHGQDYLKRQFPAFTGKSVVSKLGIEDPGFTVGQNKDNRFVLVSCSHLVSLKRIHLQIDGVASFARKHPNIHIEWHHIGGGPLKQQLHAYANQRFPPWTTWTFHGHMPNQAVLDLYKKLQPDVFLLMSMTEGLPVSIMEAHACGIPAIATNVGGVSEIVNNENGILLPQHPSTEDISRGLAALLIDPHNLNIKKKAARQNWESHFNAKNNYRLFAKMLSTDSEFTRSTNEGLHETI